VRGVSYDLHKHHMGASLHMQEPNTIGILIKCCVYCIRTDKVVLRAVVITLMTNGITDMVTK